MHTTFVNPWQKSLGDPNFTDCPFLRVKSYSDFGCCFRVKKTLNATPEHPKARARIYDEHAMQCLLPPNIINPLIFDV